MATCAVADVGASQCAASIRAAVIDRMLMARLVLLRVMMKLTFDFSRTQDGTSARKATRALPSRCACARCDLGPARIRGSAALEDARQVDRRHRVQLLGAVVVIHRAQQAV